MKFGSLFSGIGGLDLGLERAGMECTFQVENEPYCLKVLAKHWPNITRYEDIREVDFGRVEPVELLAGGFPCQDLSYAGKGAGLSGERSGLWGEFVRAIRVVRPRYVLVENVPGLLSRGMGVVLRDLCALGYDAEWESIPAAAFGAPHLRWRVFIVAWSMADTNHGGWDLSWSTESKASERHETERASALARPEQVRRRGFPNTARRNNVHGQEAGWEKGAGRAQQCGEDVAYTLSEGLEERQGVTGHAREEFAPAKRGSSDVADADAERRDGRTRVFGSGRRGEPTDSDWWSTEPDVGRVANGVPNRIHRLRGLGNAVVPQVAEWLGRLILEHELREAA